VYLSLLPSFKLTKIYTGWAQSLLKDYNDELRTIMNKYKIKTEGQAITGCIIKPPKYMKKKDDWDTEQTLLKEISTLRKETKAQLESKPISECC
jgi:hypothetical protein